MAEISKDVGALTAIGERLVNTRLPRALEIKERVDLGEVLTDYDISFLEEVFNDAREIGPILSQNPQYQDIAARVISLYKEITTKALENQQREDGNRA